MKTKLLLFIIIILFFSLPIKSYQSKKPMYIDGIVVLMNPDGSRQLKGNLKINYGTLKLTADQGTYYEKKGIAIIKGNVRVIDENRVLTCKLLTIDFNKNENTAKGNAKLVKLEKDFKTGQIKEKTTLFADTIKIFEKENIVIGNKNVLLVDETFENKVKKNSVSLFADYIKILLNKNEVIAIGNVKIKHENLVARGYSAHILQNQKKLILSGSSKNKKENFVFIENKDMFSRAKKMVYFTDPEKLILMGKAKSWQKNKKDVIFGDRIIHFPDKKTVVINPRIIYYRK